MKTNTSSLMDGKDYKKRNFVFSDDHSVDANKMVSSIDWLAEQQSQLFNQVKNGQIQIDEYEYYFELIIKQAKAMHKQEIMAAYDMGNQNQYDKINFEDYLNVDEEQYYNQTFKSE
jgi:hypothetical protein